MILKPKHTLASVAKRLADGLEDGSVVLGQACPERFFVADGPKIDNLFGPAGHRRVLLVIPHAGDDASSEAQAMRLRSSGTNVATVDIAGLERIGKDAELVFLSPTYNRQTGFVDSRSNAKSSPHMNSALST